MPTEYDIMKMTELMEVTARPSATTVPELQDEIEKYVRTHYRWQFRGFTLFHLNRKFGVTATRLGTSVRTILIELMKKHRLDLKDFKKHKVALPFEWQDQLREQAFNDPELSASQATEVLFKRVEGILEDSLS